MSFCQCQIFEQLGDTAVTCMPGASDTFACGARVHSHTHAAMPASCSDYIMCVQVHPGRPGSRESHQDALGGEHYQCPTVPLNSDCCMHGVPVVAAALAWYLQAGLRGKLPA